MNLFFCSSEKELEATLRQGRWPQACDPDLHAHVDGCRDCQGLVLVVQTLQKAKSNGEQSARLHSPGLLWWRAQLRRRNEAIQSVTEPLALAVKAGLLGLLVAFCVLVWRGGQSADLLHLFQGLFSSDFSSLGELWTMASGANLGIIVLGVAGLATLAFFASLAIFLLRDES
ncbi:MAG TPA: hypothetical protein VNB49_15050 [Candidatus Dormibacteraeota bacterium]|nr:hypothetical protein [Candidatus Dormibacteraeota bacterium]